VEQAAIRGSGTTCIAELLEKGQAAPEALNREAAFIADLQAYAVSELRRVTAALEDLAMPGMVRG